MMKKLFRGLAAFLVMMSVALAVSAKPADFSEYVTTKDGKTVLTKTLSDALEADGFMKAGADRFSTEGISVMMYMTLSPEQQASMAPDAFHRWNRTVNNLPEVILVESFGRVAGTLKMPPVQVVAQATPEAPATPVPTAAAPQVQAPPAPVVSVPNFKQQLEELTAAQDKKHTGIIGRLNEMQRELQSKPSAAQVQRIVEEAKIIASLSGRVLKLEQKVQAIEVKMGEVEAKQTEFGKSLEQLGKAQQTTSLEVLDLSNQVKELDVKGLEEKLSATEMKVYGLTIAMVLLLILCCIALWRGRGGAAKSAPVHEPFRHTAANASHVEPFLREAA